ncbi:MAG: glutamate racemase [Chloroflexota bacterium]|nr:glutamate racemase [Chloroflexota bacterium]
MPGDPVPKVAAEMTTIGLLDSGVGGLSVLREVHTQLPDVTTLYYADQAHLPYGPRDPAEVRGFVEDITTFLLAQGAQAIVIPCHTACAAGLHSLRARYPHIPIVGIEPAVKPAAAATCTGTIGVLTTEATARSAIYQSVIDRFANGVRVITLPAPELVLLAEQGAPDTPDSRQIVQAHIAPLLEAGADQIVLACTHFPFLIPLLRAAGERAALVDPSAAVARQVGRVIAGMNNPHPQPLSLMERGFDRRPHRYYTSGDPVAFAAIARRLLGYDIAAPIPVAASGVLPQPPPPPHA